MCAYERRESAPASVHVQCCCMCFSGLYFYGSFLSRVVDNDFVVFHDFFSRFSRRKKAYEIIMDYGAYVEYLTSVFLKFEALIICLFMYCLCA